MSHAQALIRPQGTSQQARCAGPDTVKATLTPRRRRRLAENDAFAAFVRRILRAYARRIAAGDVEAIFQMTDVAVEFDTLIGRPSTDCMPTATPGPRSPPGSASPARPPGSAEEARRELPPDPARRCRPRR